MKNRKYTIEIECCENEMLTKMSISKKEFDKQLRILRNQVIVTKEYETPVIEPDHSGAIFDHGTFTEKCFVFQSACCSTYLSILETKAGYVFK